ncbi:MAG: hypothetical protein IJ849_04620 [Selenomonadaceae bacterium]|nr:hypothetical protein [Selenomonadaceae bacterium]
MNIQEKIELAKSNIWQVIDDYAAHTCQRYVMDDVTEKFVSRLARDNAHAKAELRNLFRKSPVWNEELDALVINGTRTHNPDFARVQELAEDILPPACWCATEEKKAQVHRAVRLFTNPDEDAAQAIEAMNDLAPGASSPEARSQSQDCAGATGAFEHQGDDGHLQPRPARHAAAGSGCVEQDIDIGENLFRRVPTFLTPK